MRFFTEINPRSFGSWIFKGTEESTLEVDSSVPFTHQDPRDLGLIRLVKKRKIRFRILSDLESTILDFLKEKRPQVRVQVESTRLSRPQSTALHLFAWNLL